MDLQSGYWQQEVQSDDRQKTTFIKRQGLCQFKFIHFGLSNGPEMFKNLMDTEL